MLLQRVFEAIIEHKALSLVLLSRNGDPNYLRRIIETARVPVIEYWRGLGTREASTGRPRNWHKRWAPSWTTR